ncbi:MAG TPA: ATP synthase F1 subunit epsilon [Egicoccus sp.]|nr:ATP synthase F1 subunit epsilon [Egicoccus sp.]HSK22124.1 ATP synthase F1 subunit epsilon [Egicoccus sp.]
MAATMHVEVVSAERHVLSTEAKELYARSVEGEIGILPGHQPALIELDIAPVRVKLEDDSWETIAVHHGLLYVGREKIIVLADVAEPASQIDAGRAEAKLRELEAQLAEGEDAVVRASVQRARTRLAVVER